MCKQIVQSNPGSVVELTYSSDGHYEQLFIAHDVSIQGFIGPKIEEKVKINITKGEVYSVSLFMETFYAVFVGDLVLNVDIKE